MTKEKKPSVLNIRGTENLIERLDRLVAKYPLSRHAIARIALKRGLDAIESDPRWFEKAKKKP